MSRPTSPIAPEELINNLDTMDLSNMISSVEVVLTLNNVPTPPPFFSPAMEGYADYQRLYAYSMEEYIRQGWMEESVLEDLIHHPCHLAVCMYCRLGHPDYDEVKCTMCEQAPVVRQEYYPCSSVCLVCPNCNHKSWHSCSTLLLLGYNTMIGYTHMTPQ
jgi:hypothetical protein